MQSLDRFQRSQVWGACLPCVQAPALPLVIAQISRGALPLYGVGLVSVCDTFDLFTTSSIIRGGVPLDCSSTVRRLSLLGSSWLGGQLSTVCALHASHSESLRNATICPPCSLWLVIPFEEQGSKYAPLRSSESPSALFYEKSSEKLPSGFAVSCPFICIAAKVPA